MHLTPNYAGDLATRRVSLEGTRLTLSPLASELPEGMLEYVLNWRRVEAIGSLNANQPAA